MKKTELVQFACEICGNAFMAKPWKHRSRFCSRQCVLERLRSTQQKHGEAKLKTKEYTAWVNIHDRCENPRNKHYVDYGGRGIAVSPLWDDFPAFLRDVGRAPSLQHSLDRIDNMRGYEPGNVRWALPETQHNNTRVNKVLTWQGRTMTVAQWARALGMNPGTLYSRLLHGWSIDRAFSEPTGANSYVLGYRRQGAEHAS